MPMRAYPALLAFAATATAACLSIMAGWQRGGLLAERVLWVAVGVVLVVAAHLLPALCRSHGWSVRSVGAAIWIGCMATTCYGHAVFFLMAQKHAGEVRAAAVLVVTTHDRDLTVITRDRADAVTRLARANVRRCVEPCPSLTAERIAGAARVDALDVEQAEARRAEVAQDRAATERAVALVDPVTGALTAFGVTAPRAELATGLAFAAVLEAVACFCWLLALRPAAVTEFAVTPTQQGSHAEAVTPVTPTSNAAEAVTPVIQLPVVEQSDDVTRVMTAVAAGQLRATVTEIRRFLGCSQTRASEVRRLIATR